MSKKTKIGICALCGEMSELKNSHIIPRFVSNDIKKKSPTGHLRSALKPNKRIQDGHKDYLLCSNCENLFSKFERKFASNIFYPFRNGNQNIFYYDNFLNNFINSLSWRIYNNYIENGGFDYLLSSDSFLPKLYKFIIIINEEFKKYILNKENNIIINNYIFSIEDIKRMKPIDERLNYIFLQGMWGDVSFEDNLLIVSSNLGGIFLITTLSLTNKKDYKKYKVYNDGHLKRKNKRNIPTSFMNCLENTLNNYIYNNDKISNKEYLKIEKSKKK